MRRRVFTLLDALVLAVLLAGNWVLAGMIGGSGEASAVEVVSTDGTSVVPLGTNRIFEVAGPLGVTMVEIGRDGVRVRSSPCPLQICVETGYLTDPGKVIACVPNRVAIRVLARRETRDEGVDGVGR